VTTAECEFLNLYVGRTYDLIGLRLGIPSRQAESAGGAEAELESSFFSLFLFFLTRSLRMQEQINLQDWA
jgi:hypothetical protein